MRKGLWKHIGYFDILEAFRQARGCALCELEARDLRRYLDSLLYESVNDAGVRGELAESRGYCRRHADILLGFGNGLGTAILYKDQVELLVDFLRSLRGLPAKLGLRKCPESWNQAALCPACRSQARCRQGYVAWLVDWVKDSELRQAFEGSPGLCAPHLLLVLRQMRDANDRDYLAEAHVGKFSALLNDLAEFMRKHDYRFSNEPFGKEEDSWRRAVDMIVGAKEVF